MEFSEKSKVHFILLENQSLVLPLDLLVSLNGADIEAAAGHFVGMDRGTLVKPLDKTRFFQLFIKNISPYGLPTL